MVRKRKKFSAVAIPTSLYEKVEERIKGTDFTSVSNYVTYVLQEIVAGEEEKPKELTKEDEEKIKRRLEALGYL
jgi:Arc/MetJ-type ribon-helix-helix transcriptional regulator